MKTIRYMFWMTSLAVLALASSSTAFADTGSGGKGMAPADTGTLAKRR